MKSNESGSVLKLTLVLVITIAFTGLSSCQCESNLTPSASECICPGSSIQFTCATVGGGSTVWTVGHDQRCIFQLRHLEFGMPEGVARSCNDMSGAAYAIGRSLSVDNNCYTSQLTIIVESELNGTTVTCEHDNGTSSQRIGTYVIVLTSGPFSPPNNVRLTDFTAPKELTFSWSQVAPNCSTISYNIFASDSCGQCPASTALTNATCSEAQIISDAQVCDFSVQTNVCGNITGNHSNSVIIMPPSAFSKAPSVKIHPKYEQNTTRLTSFVTVIDKIAPVSVSGINIAVHFFTVNYSISGSVCDSKVIELNDQACDDERNTCTVEYDVTSNTLYCILNTESDIIVIVSATSDLGTGQKSQSRIAGSTSHFVRVSHGTNRIICTFMNQRDMSIKSCNVTFAQCGQQQTQLAFSVDSAAQLVVDLKLADLVSHCYTVTASNSTFSVLIEGSILGSQTKHHTERIAGIVVPLVVIIASIVFVTAAVILIKCKKGTLKLPCVPIHLPDQKEEHHLSKERMGDSEQPHSIQPTSQNNEVRSETSHCQEEQYDHDDQPAAEGAPQLKAVDPPQTHCSIELKSKESDTDMEQNSKQYQNIRPTTTGPQEHLTDLQKDSEHQKENAAIQQSPSGQRFQNTSEQVHVPMSPKEHDSLDLVDKSHYTCHKVDIDCELLNYVEENGMEFCRGCAFYEFHRRTEDIRKNTVIILVDKATGLYYSGERARKMVCDSPICENEEAEHFIYESEFEIEIKRPDHLLEDYIVFVQDRGNGSRCLSKGTQLLIQQELTQRLVEVPPGQLLQFPVEEECELLTFIESQTHQGENLVFQRGNAFYEFSHDSEDISGKKEVILMDVENETLHTGERARIMLGVPGKGIRNPYKDRKKWRVFIQSTCTGNRHLDKDTIVLYQADREANIKLHERKSSTASSYLADVDDYLVIDVKEDGSLRNLIEHVEKKEYERGCSYYELTDKVEDIDSSNEVILMDKDPKIPDLQSVNPEDFHHIEISQTCELWKFVHDKFGGDYKKGHAYFQFTCATEDIDRDKKILLMDKKTKELFTGIAACRMIGAPGIGIPRPPKDVHDKYTVFIQNRSRGSRCLIKGSMLLYKKDDKMKGQVK